MSMADLETVVDISVLEAEMLKPSCEHSQHTAKPQHHADGDEQYVTVFMACICDGEPEVMVLCGKFLDLAFSGSCPVYCGTCHTTLDPHEVYFVLEPVEGRRAA
jgi:hypothetical protein